MFRSRVFIYYFVSHLILFTLTLYDEFLCNLFPYIHICIYIYIYMLLFVGSFLCVCFICFAPVSSVFICVMCTHTHTFFVLFSTIPYLSVFPSNVFVLHFPCFHHLLSFSFVGLLFDLSCLCFWIRLSAIYRFMCSCISSSFLFIVCLNNVNPPSTSRRGTTWIHIVGCWPAPYYVNPPSAWLRGKLAFT